MLIACQLSASERVYVYIPRWPSCNLAMPMLRCTWGATAMRLAAALDSTIPVRESTARHLFKAGWLHQHCALPSRQCQGHVCSKRGVACCASDREMLLHGGYSRQHTSTTGPAHRMRLQTVCAWQTRTGQRCQVFPRLQVSSSSCSADLGCSPHIHSGASEASLSAEITYGNPSQQGKLHALLSRA